MLSVVGFFGRGFDSHRLHHFFTALKRFVLTTCPMLYRAERFVRDKGVPRFTGILCEFDWG